MLLAIEEGINLFERAAFGFDPEVGLQGC